MSKKRKKQSNKSYKKNTSKKGNKKYNYNKSNLKKKEKNLTKTLTEINELIDDIKESKEEIQELVKKNKLSKKKSHKLMYYILITIFISLLIIYITIPKIKLLGSNVTITYRETYQEPGFIATKMGKNINDLVSTNNNILDKTIGNYTVTYKTKYLFFNIKRTRKVTVIDDEKPIINIENPIKICPSTKVSDIKYSAIDEYDGNITDKVKIIEKDNKLTLSVSDSSNNLTTTTVNIIRKDTDAPVINLKGNKTIYLSYNTKFNEPGYTANDLCDGDLTNKVEVTGTVENTIGTHKITYKVKDSSGNETIVTRTVIITSNQSNSGSIQNGTIYLTFDDGPNEETTEYILDVLKEEGVKATFFVTCNGPDYLIKRMYNEGHTVALHTATHNYSYIYSSKENYFADLERVSNRVKNITGYESKIIRFPGGSSNTISRNYKIGIMSELTTEVLNRGYRYYDWNVDADDAGKAYTKEQVYNNVTSHLSHQRSNMVLMHDVKYQTKSAIRDIIRYAKANGYTFKKIEMNTYMIRHYVNN